MKRFVPFRKQQGTVLITVVLIASFVVVIMVEAVKTVRYQKQLSSNLINRDQAYSYLMGMEELAKIWLKRAFDSSNDETVHLGQLWAQDDITFPLDGGGMTATIRDMQSCFNLNAIALKQTKNSGNNGGQQQRDDINLQPTIGQLAFEELINKVNESSDLRADDLAAAVRDWLDEDIDPFPPNGAEDDYYQGLEVPYRTPNAPIAHVSELRTVRDFTSGLYQKLLPHICVLPDPEVNQINVNTVPEDSAVLIHALLDSKDITLEQVKNALSARGDEGFSDLDDFIAEFDTGNKDKLENQDWLSVTSEYFEISAIAEIGNTRVRMKTLMKKNENNEFAVLSRYIGKE